MMSTYRTVTDKKLQVIFFSLLLICSCTKEEKATKHDYPRVATGQVTNIAANGATFNGSFLQAGNSEIIDHGFIFKIDDAFISYSVKISLGSSNGSGSFTATANDGLENGEKYYVNAYAQNKDKIFYGKSVRFVCKDNALP